MTFFNVVLCRGFLDRQFTQVECETPEQAIELALDEWELRRGDRDAVVMSVIEEVPA